MYMAEITIHAPCGVLGDIELTVLYEPYDDNPFWQEIRSVGISSIKIGGSRGQEVDVSDNYIADEIIPACIADWNSHFFSSSEKREETKRVARLLFKDAA